MIDADIMHYIGQCIDCNETMSHFLEYLRGEYNYHHLISPLLKEKTFCMETIIKNNYTSLFSITMDEYNIHSQIQYIDMCIKHGNKDILEYILSSKMKKCHEYILIQPLLSILRPYVSNIIPHLLQPRINVEHIIEEACYKELNSKVNTFSHYLFNYMDLSDTILSQYPENTLDFSSLIYYSFYSPRSNTHLGKDIISTFNLLPKTILTTDIRYKNIIIIYYFLYRLRPIQIEYFIIEFVYDVFQEVILKIKNHNDYRDSVSRNDILKEQFSHDIDIPISYIEHINNHIKEIKSQHIIQSKN